MKKDGPPPPPPQALTSNMAAHKQEICHGLCRSRLRVVAFGSVLLLLVVGGLNIAGASSCSAQAACRAPRLTCPAMKPAGAVAGIYLVQQEQKRQQGASAPEAIKAQAGEDIMRQRAHGTCLACAHSASATQSLKTVKPHSQTSVLCIACAPFARTASASAHCTNPPNKLS